MGRLREIARTAAFAWSTDISKPLIVTGTRAGAVAADFSNETKLEIWDLGDDREEGSAEPQPLASLTTDSRFFDIAWSKPVGDYSEGIIAGALENGGLDLWDAKKLQENPKTAHVARVEKHTGPIKALQFNPHKPSLLATAGAKGELYITDIENPQEPYRVGGTGRSDDFDTLDWNKDPKVSHILVTGSSGGFITVWDVKSKKESLNIDNYGRKPVSSVAWDPHNTTRLATAANSDQDPVVLMWNLRNSNAPEKILKGHNQGVLSISWCSQDPDLLLSCGKDNRNICWDVPSGQMLGEFPVVTNWTFQTRWNQQHPNLLATASFDGKLLVQSVQNTNSKPADDVGEGARAGDGADFFAQAHTRPQGSSFTLSKPPKWMKRPAGVAFGFGGKIVDFKNLTTETPVKSTVSISTFVEDEKVEASIEEFQDALKGDDIAGMCDSRIEKATDESDKEDWRIIKTLVSTSPRKQILSYLGFDKTQDTKSKDAEDTNGDEQDKKLAVNGDAKSNRLSSFFGGDNEGSGFLADLASSRTARTNNPFKIYSGSESEVDREITKALMLGSFDRALEACLREKRMSDAFMIAICGGQECIDKAQKAYFAQVEGGPNYLRLLASVVGKNLWDTVYNADLENWKEVMATLCTFADAKEFPDLCEALGERLEQQDSTRRDASFCYLAGSKLERVVPIWITEMQNNERETAENAADESSFSIHVQSLQGFIEKVSIFRRATNYKDDETHTQGSSWKLEPLYAKYAEYAEVLASHGHLDMAGQYLSLLPATYAAAEVARNRVTNATKKAAVVQKTTPRVAQTPFGMQPTSTTPQPAAYAPAAAAANAYMPDAAYLNTGPTPYPPQQQPAGGRYGPVSYNSYQPSAPAFAPPLATQTPPPPSAPPKDAAATGNWNDLPDGMAAKPRSRNPTPAPNPGLTSPYAQGMGGPQYSAMPPAFNQARATPPLPPPPKAGAPPPPRVDSPMTGYAPPGASAPPLGRPGSSAASTYAPPLASQPPPGAGAIPPPAQPPRGASPYNPPPSGAPPSNRYAPAPAQPGAAPVYGGPPSTTAPRQPAPNPYAPPTATSPPAGNYAPPRQPMTTGPPPTGPPRASAGPPPAARPPSSGPSQSGTPAPKYPSGDRSHIPPALAPIYEYLSSEMHGMKSRSPESYRAKVEDTEKRLNILFDDLNNETLPDAAINQLRQLVGALQAKNYDQAMSIHTELMVNLEGGKNWLVGVKRLIQMIRAIGPSS